MVEIFVSLSRTNKERTHQVSQEGSPRLLLRNLQANFYKALGGLLGQVIQSIPPLEPLWLQEVLFPMSSTCAHSLAEVSYSWL